MEKVKSKKRGITLVETIVAMALVVIISASVYVTCNYTLKAQNENSVKTFFATETENLAVCYYNSNQKKNTSAENYENFKNAFEFSSGLSNVENDYFDFAYVSGTLSQIESITIYYSKDFVYLAKDSKDDSSFKIVFTFKENQNGNYLISSYSTSSGNLIFSREV